MLQGGELKRDGRLEGMASPPESFPGQMWGAVAVISVDAARINLRTKPGNSRPPDPIAFVL